MSDFKTIILQNGKKYETLADILPEKGNLDILFLAKTPAPVSVESGHYFQGRQGKMFWNKLLEYNILNVPYGKYPDECLADNNYGITDIVKIPRNFGCEPSNNEYEEGYDRIISVIDKFKPKVIVFVYKRVLDNILFIKTSKVVKSNYGFNPQFDKYFNGAKVFVFPMPGTPCTKDEATYAMNELRGYLNK
jgi:uracil-DNA glycosylase